jgi:hypothetical protein
MFDPHTDIPRAVVDFGPVRFLDREKLHGLLVYQEDVFEVENQCTASFFFEQSPKRVNVFPVSRPLTRNTTGSIPIARRWISPWRHLAGSRTSVFAILSPTVTLRKNDT